MLNAISVAPSYHYLSLSQVLSLVITILKTVTWPPRCRSRLILLCCSNSLYAQLYSTWFAFTLLSPLLHNIYLSTESSYMFVSYYQNCTNLSCTFMHHQRTCAFNRLYWGLRVFVIIRPSVRPTDHQERPRDIRSRAAERTEANALSSHREATSPP